MSAPGALVAVLGSVNMDLVTTTDRLPEAGQTVLGASFSTVCGGKGANQAIAAARAGGRVSMVGAVGDDDFGIQLRANLERAGVLSHSLRTVDGSSGIASIVVDATGENVIVVVPGANGTMDSLTVSDEELLAAVDMVVCQLEIPLHTVVRAAQIVDSAGHLFLLNPSPMTALPAALLANTTILVLNQGEADSLGTDQVKRVPHVVTTLGARGAHYRGPDGATAAVPAPSVTAVDTTGAGDAFTGALAVAWVEGRQPVDAIRFACAAGALATTQRGAGSSPGRAAVDDLVARTY